MKTDFQMRPTVSVQCGIALSVFLCTAGALKADVVVIVNRTSAPLTFSAETSGGAKQDRTLARGELTTIPMRSTASLTCPTAEPKTYQLEANSAYYFQQSKDNKIVLQQIDLGNSTRSSEGRELAPGMRQDTIKIIPIKILVDDEEQAVKQVWEARLRKRIEAASKIFTSYFHVGFEVVAAEVWQSDSIDPAEAQHEFESEVESKPARLAIGFTSQFQLPDGGANPDIFPAPLNSHLLVCERSQHLTETERLELLLHGLGHFFGAVHSPESESIMRLHLGDGQSRRTDFRLAFDPVNTLAIYLVAEEIRFRDVDRLSQLSDGTVLRLRELYTVIDEVLANDSLASRAIEALDQGRNPSKPAIATTSPATADESKASLASGVRMILRDVVAAARANAALAARNPTAGNQPRQLTGDELTSYYVQHAARAAVKLEPAIATRAFLVAIGIGLDHSTVLRNNPLAGDLCIQSESDAERRERLQFLGQPTMLGRRDLAQHFAVSCFLTAAFSEDVAEAAGLAKEILDARGGSGFSFVDLAADYAGIALAKNLLAKRLLLRDIAVNFTVADFMPSIADLPEGLTWEAFSERFGSTSDDRFQRIRQQIRSRVSKLPIYTAYDV